MTDDRMWDEIEAEIVATHVASHGKANGHGKKYLEKAAVSARSVMVGEDCDASEAEAIADMQGDPEDPGVALSTEARPVVVVSTDVAEVADKTEQALAASRNIFSRAHSLVRVVRGHGSPVISTFSPTSLREEISRRCVFKSVREDKEGKRSLVSCMPPRWVAEALVERGSWNLPALEGIVESPTIRPNGTILDVAGYDQATGIVYVPSATFPRVPVAPNHTDAEAAVKDLLDPLTDFPFTTDGDKAAAVAAILTVVGRTAISGCCPAFAPDAPTPGTGKSLLADVISLLADGHPASRMTAPSDDAEAGKSILALGLEGDRVVLIDNIVDPFGGAVFSSVLTSGEFKGRILGLSRTATIPCRMVWMLTGNNLRFRGDFGRRVLTITLDAARENPEDRTGFKHADLLGWVRDNRPRLVVSALTILRAYHCAGLPPHGQSRMGSFESWDDLIRGAVVWAGMADPCSGRARLREEADADLEPLRCALHAWREAVAGRPETVASMVDLARSNVELRAALAGLCPRSDGDHFTSRELGVALRLVKKRVADGMRLETDGVLHGNQRWKVVTLGM